MKNPVQEEDFNQQKYSRYPRFTVIIPQKDRSEYLFHTLRTCMIQDYPNFEVIVSDDHSEDDSVEMVRRLQQIDSRIRLFAHDHHLGMRDNFEFALNHVNEGYVIALGGDDGLLPGCIWKMYHLLKDNKVELLTWPLVYYSYPPKGGDKSLYYFKREKKFYTKRIKSVDFLNKISKSFNYLIDECPMFYIKGIASMDLVNRVKSRTKDGSFYYCPTPDGFSGVVLAGEVEDYIYTNEPLTIGGSTYKSQGQNYRRTDKKSREEAQQFFNDNIRRTMHDQLASQPYSPIITLMTADYLLTAKDLPGWPGKFEMFSYDSLIRESFKMIANGSYAMEVLPRELKILREIAKQHGLETLFEYLLNNTKKIIKETNPIYGLTLTHSFRFEGSTVGINNIFDAAIATNFAIRSYQLISFKSLLEIIRNTIKTAISSRKYKKIGLPQGI